MQPSRRSLDARSCLAALALSGVCPAPGWVLLRLRGALPSPPGHPSTSRGLAHVRLPGRWSRGVGGREAKSHSVCCCHLGEETIFFKVFFLHGLY